ncbi:MAG: hypothetical protein WCC90_01815, partial [Methylocella sp.]
ARDGRYIEQSGFRQSSWPHCVSASYGRCNPLQPPILCHSPTNDFEDDPYPTHYPDVKEPPYDPHDAPPAEQTFLPEAAKY